jgi:cardiolipin synthase
MSMPLNQTTTVSKTGASTSMNGHAYSLPNLLTYGRIMAVPAVAVCLLGITIYQAGLWLRWVALAIFLVAAITDLLDGWVARTWGEQSRLGQMLDPIADKLLVGGCLFMLAADDTIRGWSLWAALIILCREILVSGLREFLAELRVSVPVSRLAKWKTTMQLVAVGFLLAGPAGDAVHLHSTMIGISLLWISALLTLYTGFDYFRAGVRHIVNGK